MGSAIQGVTWRGIGPCGRVISKHGSPCGKWVQEGCWGAPQHQSSQVSPIGRWCWSRSPTDQSWQNNTGQHLTYAPIFYVSLVFEKLIFYLMLLFFLLMLLFLMFGTWFDECHWLIVWKTTMFKTIHWFFIYCPLSLHLIRQLVTSNKLIFYK